MFDLFVKSPPASNYSSFFSPDYFISRARFVEQAERAGMTRTSYPIAAKGPKGEMLSIDVARLGPKKPEKTLVLSSGLHGVEGYLGAAAQLAFMQRMPALKPGKGVAIAIIHALNPYGFAWNRRVNEDNVDLNRNFLLEGEVYEGVDDSYVELHDLLNPARPPGKINAFVAKAVAQIALKGMRKMKQTFSGGQYEYQRGISFGGKGPTESCEIVKANLSSWVGDAKRVLHVDYHSGLGKSGTYRIFADRQESDEGFKKLARIYGADFLEPWGGELSYNIRGGLGAWCKERFGSDYDVLCAEFGTLPPILVGQAIHYENRAHHYGDPMTPEYQAAKKRILAAFRPDDEAWREAVVSRSLAIADQSLAALLQDD